MIAITNTDGQPLNSLRLRPAQEITVRLSTGDLTPLIASIQATRADFLLTEPVGETESVSRGNGQELLDDGLIEALLDGAWVPLNEVREVGFIMQGEPVDVTLRVKNVGQAVGEVAFGLAAIGLSLSKLMLPVSNVLTVSGFEGYFLKIAGDTGWFNYPSEYEPTITQGEMQAYADVDFLTLEYGVTELGTFVDNVRTIVAEGLLQTQGDYLAAKLTGGYNVRKGSIPALIPVASDLTQVVVNDIMLMTVPLYAATGEDYTHKSAGVPIDDKLFYIFLRYSDDNVAWELCHSYFDEDDEEIIEVIFSYGTDNSTAVPAIFGDTGIYFFERK